MATATPSGKAKKQTRVPLTQSQKPQNPVSAKFPRHNLEKSLRIPRAILDQNAGKPCTPKDAAKYLGATSASGPFALEISSAIKYGLLDRPEPGKISPSDLAKKILRPTNDRDEISGYREAIFKAPDISEVYKHYRGENLPDEKFFKNAIVDIFKIPRDKADEFKNIFIDSLITAKLINNSDGKNRILDIIDEDIGKENNERIKQLGKNVKIDSNDTCFVMQPFAAPLGGYYEKIYKPAIEKAGLKAIRADAEIFGSGKIIDQIWRGIKSSKVLVAELTSKNPNVFYELGLAHALKKPVVLVTSNENDVPFDLKHIRVIYYDTTDPFWGIKLIEKVAENILSAIKNPEEAVFEGDEISSK